MKKSIKVTLILVAVSAVFNISVPVGLIMWNIYQPISFGVADIKDQIESGEIKGEPYTISKADYSISYVSNMTNNELDEYKDLYFLPGTARADALSFFIFFQAKKMIDTSLTFKAKEIYLKANYANDNDYQNDKKIVIDKEYCKYRKPLFSNNLFVLPSLLFVYNHDSEFTYILFDDAEKSIIFISFAAINYCTNIVFDSKYVPTKRLCDSDLSKKDYKNHYFDCTK